METNQETNFLPQYTIEQFRALSEPERRRAIARDAIAQIQAGRLRARNGKYFVADAAVLTVGADLREVLIQPQASCTVCGLGACLASVVRLDNNFVVADGDLRGPSFSEEGTAELWKSWGKFLPKLEEFFSPVQLSLIESAFELGEFGYCSITDNRRLQDLQQTAIMFGAEASPDVRLDAEKRLLAILNNIAADEEGLFRP